MKRLAVSPPAATTLLSAAAYVLCFPPHDQAWLGFFALVPFFIRQSLPGKTRRDSLIQAFWLGVLVTLGGFFWVAYVLKQFGGLPWPVAALGLLGFSTFGQFQWLIIAPLVQRFSREALAQPRWKALGILVWLALGYTAIEWLTPKLFRDTFGHHWIAHENLRMNARWAGAYGLTFLSALVNLSLAQAWLEFRAKREPSAWPTMARLAPTIGVTAALYVAAWIYGYHTRNWVTAAVDSVSQKLRLAVIQANIGDIDKLAAETGLRGARRRVMDTFLGMSDEALADPARRPQAVVWPETAYPSSFRKPRYSEELEFDQRVEEFARSRQVGIFFGGYDENPRTRKDYNAFFLLGRNAGPNDLQAYYKTRLLLFGEEMPLSGWFPLLRQWFPQVGNFERGNGPEAFTLPTIPPVKAAPAICYEVLFADDMARARQAGAQFILNITNDSWFGPAAEPQLHLGLSRFRSIELGIPMLRATNTGISALVDPAGRILSQTETFVPAILNSEIPLVDLPPSLVERWGDAFPKIALLLFMSVPVGVWARKRKR